MTEMWENNIKIDLKEEEEWKGVDHIKLA